MRMDTMSKDQAESSCSIQSKLDTLLRKSFTQDETVPEKMVKQTGTMVDFAEPHRKKQESTLLTQIVNIIGSETIKMAIKGGASNSARVPRESNVHTSVAPNALKWANS